MAEVRTCPVTGRTVIVRPEWVDVPPTPVRATGACEECRPANAAIRWAEGAPAPSATPPPVVGTPRRAGALIARQFEVTARAHPVPVLALEGDPAPRTEAGAVRRDAFGIHERIAGPHVAREGLLLDMVAQRIDALRRDARLRSFRAGRRHVAGAHAAWTLYGLPWETAPDVLAPWRARERADGARTLLDGDGAFAAMAWAPRVPFEAWVCPAQGTEPFGRGTVLAVGDAVARVRTLLGRALRDPVIDLVLVEGTPWRIELVPRLANGTLVEAATGLPVHGVLPEAAATFLRDLASVPSPPSLVPQESA